MQNVSCPSCGAPVSFRSSASVMTVCAFCHSTLLKEADAVRDIGKMSLVLEDYSPIQIGTSGLYQARHFTVVGRIQLAYEDGYWNEWYVLFDEGDTGWLSDASGQYVFTCRPKNDEISSETFQSIHLGSFISWRGEQFVASDVREAHCVSGQGELPFTVGQGWKTQTADFRAKDRFMTLDWSDTTTAATRYVGYAVTLNSLKCQNLRHAEEVGTRSGKYRGKIEALNCPHCAGSIKYVVGMTNYLLCPSCHAEVSLNADKVEVLSTESRLQKVTTTLKPGDTGKIDDSVYEVLGVVIKKEVGEVDSWTEYLLFSPGKDFLWLIESEEGWERASVLNVWPEYKARPLMLGTERLKHLFDYAGEVTWAAGSFNWRIKQGEHTNISDYTCGKTKLSCEMTDSEITWSQSTPVSSAQLASWFPHLSAQSAQEPPKTSPLAGVAKIFTWFLLVLNVPIMMAGSSVLGFFLLMFGVLLLWFPVWMKAKMDIDLDND